MRVGSLFSALLHGGVVALLLWSFNDAAGGMPAMGAGGGAVSFEVVVALPGSTPADEALASNATEETPPDQTEFVEAAVPPPPPPAKAPVQAAPPPPAEEPVAEILDLPTAPIGPDPNVPLPVAEVEPEPEVTPEEVALEEITEPEPPEETEVTAAEPEEAIEPEPIEEVAEVPPEPEPEPLEEIAEVEPEPEPLEEIAEVEPEEVPPEQDLSMVPPEKPLKPVEVPAPQLVEKPKPEPKPEQVAEVADQGQQEVSSTAAQAGDELAALPGDASNATVGTQGLPGPAGGAVIGMSSGELANYTGMIQAWLDKHKRYPDSSRRRREEGVVMVEFSIDGSGRVLSHRLVDASGYQLLDAEAEALLNRASPLPAPPDGNGRSFRVPIVFALR